jgi:negative regulator of sigma E activity
LPASFATQERLSFQPALPCYLPRGYVLDRVTRSQVGTTEVVRTLYTDGLNTLSLVEWRGSRDPEDWGRERFWGPGDRVHRALGTINLTLCGDLPAAELRRIAGSIGVSKGLSRPLITRK